jgi:hypothetical protein
MKDLTGIVSRRRNTVVLFACALAAVLTVYVSEAQVTLTDGNSAAHVNLGSDGGALGMNSWTVNDQNQLAQQWFWIGAGGAAQVPINSGAALTYVNPLPNVLSATFASSLYAVRVDYTLSGGSAGGHDWTSDITETLNILNPTATAQTYHFFQFSHFTIGGPGAPNNVQIGPGPTGNWRALQSNHDHSSQLAETIDLPVPDHSEAAFYSSTLDRLNSGVPITLSDMLSAGPGDVTWAFEWDLTIAAGASVDILKDKRLSVAPVPEPATAALLGLGLLVFTLRRKS